MSGVQGRADTDHERFNYLTVEQQRRLSWACAPIRAAFGCPPYLVGSALTRPTFRDVDLRMPMWPERGGTDFEVDGDRLATLNVLISHSLAMTTGLPIDFQFQDRDEWAEHDGEMRNPMGVGDV